MTERSILTLPRVSANEDTAILVEWVKPSGAFVRVGEIVCTAETTKSLFEVEATAEGYLFILAQAGHSIAVGQSLAVISSDSTDTPEAIAEWMSADAHMETRETEAKQRTWTQKAGILARRHGIDLNKIPSSSGKISEADIRSYLDGQQSPDKSEEPDLPGYMQRSSRIERVLIIGGGDGAAQVLDAIYKCTHQHPIGILDDNSRLHGTTIMGVNIIGQIDLDHVLTMMHRGEFDSAVISISTLIPVRKGIFEQLSSRGVTFTNVIHPTACIGANARLGRGNVILAFCHVGAFATIGDNNFLSAYVSIEHHNNLGNHCSYGPAVVASSRVKVGDCARLGTGVFIEPHITIGENAIIGSGCILRGDITDCSIVRTHLNYVARPQRQENP